MWLREKERMNNQHLSVWISLEKLEDLATCPHIPAWPQSAAAGWQLPDQAEHSYLGQPCPQAPMPQLLLDPGRVPCNESCHMLMSFFYIYIYKTMYLSWTVITMTPRALISQLNTNPTVIFKYGTEDSLEPNQGNCTEMPGQQIWGMC